MQHKSLCVCSFATLCLLFGLVLPVQAQPEIGCAANGLTPVQGTNWGTGLSEPTWQFIQGDPLLIAVGDRGDIRVWLCQPSPRNIQHQYFNANSWGTNVWLAGADTAKRYNTSYYGGTDPVAVSHVKATAGSETTVTTVMSLGADAQLRQVITYVAGSYNYKLRWELTNTTGATQSDLRFFHGGDTFFGGDDSARSWWNPTQNMVYVNNSSFLTSGIMGF